MQITARVAKRPKILNFRKLVNSKKIPEMLGTDLMVALEKNLSKTQKKYLTSVNCLI